MGVNYLYNYYNIFLFNSPGRVAAGPDGAEPGQRLGEVRVDGRQGDAAQALQLAGRVAVEALRAVVEQRQRQQQQQHPGERVANHHQRAQQADGVGQQDVQGEGQAVVHGVQVRGEAVEDAAHRGGVEEGDCGLRGVGGGGVVRMLLFIDL